MVGNHDISENGRANYYELFGKFYYSFSVGPAYFIVLDDANERELDPWQMDWLKDELQKSQDYKYRFIVMHVPLYDPRQGDYEIGHSLQNPAFAKRLNDIFDENKVTMLLVSHIHGYYSGIWGKTPYLITAGAGAELRGSDPGHDFYHYIKVDVSGPEVKYAVVKIDTPQFELIDRLIANGWIYLYAFVVIHFFDAIIILTSVYLAIYIVFHKKEWLILSLGKKKKQG